MKMMPTFKRLNEHWNAEPNAPDEKVTLSGTTLHLSFFLNPWLYEAEEGERRTLTFEQCSMWRLGPTNEEGWYRGQCRYGKAAEWGEFYELLGNDEHLFKPTDWHEIGPLSAKARHFLFYLRDNTFECLAYQWQLAPPIPDG